MCSYADDDGIFLRSAGTHPSSRDYDGHGNGEDRGLSCSQLVWLGLR